MVNPLFKLQGLDVPFNDATDEWMTAVYKEDGFTFDLISAGSGFLQVINLLSFLFLHTSRVALLDEPDSHMHDDLQKLTFDLLDRLSQERNIQLIIATHSPILIDSAGLGNVLLIDRSFPNPLKAQQVEELVPLLGDRGISLPPAKVMNTLKSRKVLFVEGLEADYEEFVQRIGEIYDSAFRTKTRGLTVFETKGATQKWPFDAIEHFERLIGVPLCYIFISDRDFLTDDQILERERRSNSEGRKIKHLLRRHRESYLLEPAIIARLLARKWELKQPGTPVPQELAEQRIREFVLTAARSASAATRARFQNDQEIHLRLPASERVAALERLTQFFDRAYVDELNHGRVPYKLLDAKDVLRDLRGHITRVSGIVFSDKEIIETFRRAEIAPELEAIFHEILTMFVPHVRVRRRGAAASGVGLAN